MVDFESIQRKLKKKDIIIDTKTISRHSQQGSMNEIYFADSNIGKLLIQVGRQHDKKLQYKKAKRVFYLSKFFAEHPDIPTVEFIMYGKDSEGNIFTVQKFVEGKTYRQTKGYIVHLKHLAKIISKLHKIDMEGAGYIKFKDEEPGTTHKDWYSFIKDMPYKSLREIYKAKKISEEEYKKYKIKIKNYLKKYNKYIKGVKGKLMHGDLTLGNVLIHGRQVNALIDLEFSCVGDPAWEFATHKFYKLFLKYYFKELKELGMDIDEEDFLLRIRIYSPIKQLVIADSLKNNKKSFPICWKAFCDLLDKML